MFHKHDNWFALFKKHCLHHFYRTKILFGLLTNLLVTLEIGFTQADLSECELPKATNLQISGECCEPDDEVTFFCDSGYIIQGVASAVCLRTGRWSQPIPRCIKILQCTDPGIPNFSIRAGSCCEIGSTMTYKCDDGYELMDTENEDTITCLSNNEWNGTIPRCKPKGKAACPYIPIEKNNLAIVGDDEEVFLDGSEVQLDCKPGFYNDDEEMYLLCESDGTWDVPVPTCKPISDCELPTGANLQISEISGGCCEPDDEVMFFCDDGFVIQGASSAVCWKTGNWSQPIPQCTKIKRCTDPGIPIHRKRTGNCCEVGSVLKYECTDGYEQMDNNNGNTITCLSNEEWSGTIPRCKPIGKAACPDIPTDKNNLTILSGLPSDEDVFLDGIEIHLTCKPGFYTSLPGFDEDIYLECGTNGTWDVPVPACKPKGPCSRPLAPSHGRIPKLIMNPNQTEFPLWYEIEIECEKGYISKNGYGSQCEGNDAWSRQLYCTRITCSNPGIPSNGNRYGNDFHVNSNVTFDCMGSSYQLIGSSVRTCKENGRWSGITTVCDGGDSDCIDPGVPVNSYRKGNKFNIGDVVTYSCKKRTTLIGNGTRECLDGEDRPYWSGSEIECQAQHEFTDTDDAVVVFSETVAAISRPSLQKGPVASFLTRSMENKNKTGVSGTDIFFAFDGSASITAREFNYSKDFVITFIRQVGVSHRDGGIRVAVILFSKKVTEVASLTMRTVGEVIREIKNMTGNQLGTDITKGLKSLQDLAQRSIETNVKRKKIAFIITDGMWNTGGNPSPMAKKLRDPLLYNVELFAVGVGSRRNDIALEEIVGPDKRKNVLRFKNYEDFINTVAIAANRVLDYSACGFERPVSLNDSSSKGNRKLFRPLPTNSDHLARIVGGKEVKRPWPWMAALSQKGKITCGGSIIHQQWILTAAHCFEGNHPDLSDWKVTVGATDLRKDTGWDLRIDYIKVHDNFNRTTLDFDAALVKLKLLIQYDIFIRPICLPPAFKALPKNTELYAKNKDAMVIGYGHTKEMDVRDEGGETVDILQELYLILRSEKVCQKEVSHSDLIFQPTPQMICAGSGKKGKDACKGDSGGPLMQMTVSTSRNNTQERWFLVGITSFGVGCGLEGYYSYYSNVAKLRDWIENTTNVEFENVIPLPEPRRLG